MGLRPKISRLGERIHASRLLPSRFVTETVNFAMVNTAERHRKLVAHLSPERAGLRKAQVMSIARLPSTDG
jgi:hypothetical protein